MRMTPPSMAGWPIGMMRPPLMASCSWHDASAATRPAKSSAPRRHVEYVQGISSLTLLVDGAIHQDPLNRRRQLQRLAIEGDQVGVAAGFDGADAVLQAEQPGRRARDRFQRGLRRQP